MASYQTRARDPLLDTKMQAAIEKRGTELIGLALIALGVLVAMMVWSYSPDDPSWMSATDAPVQNWLGRMGASVAAPLFMIIGWGTWGIAAVLAVWGLRFVAHMGKDRAIGRLIFAPIWIALLAVYASTLAPSADWTHSFGLGGLFGDTVLSILLTVAPVTAALGIKALSLLAALATIAFGAFVLGFTMAELRRIGRFLLVGTIVLYDALLRVLGRGASGAASAARTLRERQARDPEEAEPGEIEEAPRRLRLPKLLGASRDELPEPELVERAPLTGQNIPEGDDARIRAKISDVIRSRVGRQQEDAPRQEPVVTAGPTPSPRVEPTLTAQRVTEPEEPRRLVQPQVKKAPQPSKAAVAEAQPGLRFDEAEVDYESPPLSLLTDPASVERHYLSEEALEQNARMLESVLDDYGVKGEIVSVRPGPVVTMYELEPAPGLKASRVIGLSDDIARSMSALSARVSTVPGRSVIGIELPNEKREKVVLREILSDRDFGDTNAGLPLALGKDIGGTPVVANLAKMPHLLIAGTTGSGKSVAINTMILSLLYRLSPEECRLIMIDPKMLELSVYDGIPHLLSPVVTDPKKAVVALKWVVGEMEERYRKMSKMGVRNIEGYNGRVKDALGKGEMFSRTVQTGFDDETGEPIWETEEIQPETLPYIVVIVDEMADLMMVAGKEIEACIQRLAQMARASGIHLIMATQRPSVDVITGTIKANFPTRISFQVTGKIDSRTILGEQGAEQLLGMGDMLWMAGGGKITRVHGPFCSDEEVEEIVTFLKQFGPPDYQSGVVEGPDGDDVGDIDLVLGLGGNTGGEDALYDQAVAIVAKDRKCSTSYIQRKLAIGYNKAARLVEQMEEQGVVTPANHVGKREILIPET
ncbi:DNA translocase FtsK 4TM domain-containing protein [Aestuariibius sp. 2305UL40-4]|uniref:DNA translocase FtsK 4TM domain-containing protein n=1 Tax=Aestuariibius violaceus TaxID=3234132 RepID=UPI00345E167D